MRRTAATGTLRGVITAALDGHGGCLSRLRLEGRSTGVRWCSGARRGGQVAMGGPQEPSERSIPFTADGVSSDAGLADLWQARPCNGQLTAAVMSPIAARRHGARGCTSRHLGRRASLILGAPRPPLPRGQPHLSRSSQHGPPMASDGGCRLLLHRLWCQGRSVVLISAIDGRGPFLPMWSAVLPDFERHATAVDRDSSETSKTPHSALVFTTDPPSFLAAHVFPAFSPSGTY